MTEQEFIEEFKSYSREDQTITLGKLVAIFAAEALEKSSNHEAILLRAFELSIVERLHLIEEISKSIRKDLARK